MLGQTWTLHAEAEKHCSPAPPDHQIVKWAHTVIKRSRNIQWTTNPEREGEPKITKIQHGMHLLLLHRNIDAASVGILFSCSVRTWSQLDAIRLAQKSINPKNAGLAPDLHKSDTLYMKPRRLTYQTQNPDI